MKKTGETAGGLPFALTRRKSVTVFPNRIVSMEYFDSSRRFPLVVLARDGETDLIGWVKANLALIASELSRHGAILFRGFSVTSAEQFLKLVGSVSGEALTYNEQTSPRRRVLKNVYTSTDYPSDQAILPHNENSYAITFPRKLYFWCQAPARQGGQTPLCDTRKVLARISPVLAGTFLRKGWMYVRNFTPNLGVSWQTAFQSNDHAQIEDYCRRAAIGWEWTRDGLRTRQIRPAVIRHPETGELSWFNHVAFFHISSVEPNLRARLLAQYGEQDLPNNTYYGDGSVIEDSVVQNLLEAYRDETVSFAWEPRDIVLIDNMLTAHARAPFIGPRRILVAMTEPHVRTDVTISH